MIASLDDVSDEVSRGIDIYVASQLSLKRAGTTLLLCSLGEHLSHAPHPADPATRVWITTRGAVRHLDLVNAIYGQVLVLPEETHALSGGATDRREFVHAATFLMHALSALGQKLARIPTSLDQLGVMAGLTFTVPRNPGAREPGAGGLILESPGELSAAYRDIVTDKDPSPVEQTHQHIERQVQCQLRAGASPVIDLPCLAQAGW